MHNANQISFFVPSFNGGGAERVMISFSNELISRGFDVDFLVAADKGPFRNELSKKANLVVLGNGGVLRAFPRLCQYMLRKSDRPLITSVGHVNLIAIVAKFLTGFKGPLLVREANTPSNLDVTKPPLKSRFTNLLLKTLYRHADIVIAPSQGVIEELRSDFHVSDKKLFLVHSGSVPSNLEEMMQEPSGYSELDSKISETKAVLAMGRLVPAKGFDVLMSAFARSFKGKDVKLFIFGEGPLRSELENQSNRLGIGPQVVFPGFHSNPFSLFSRADLFVLSSRREGMPNVLIQALACGCPVVATNCKSGPSEIIAGSQVGSLVEVDDIEGMAIQMQIRLSKRLPQDLVNKIRVEYSAKKCADKLIDIIHYSNTLRLPGSG